MSGAIIAGLTNHLWQSTVFAAAAGLATVAFRRNRASVRYWLWLCASLKFLLPFALLVSLGSHLAWKETAKPIAAPSISLAMAQIAQPFPETLPFAASAPRHTDGLGAIPFFVLGVWACGFAAIVAVRFKDWLRIRAVVRAASPLSIEWHSEERSDEESYAESILQVCQFYVQSPLSCASGITGSDLKKRVERIMRNQIGETLNGWRKLFLVMAAALALAVPLVIGVLRLEAQAPAAPDWQKAAGGKAAFDVASVKLWDPSGGPPHTNIYLGPGDGPPPPGGYFSATM